MQKNKKEKSKFKKKSFDPDPNKKQLIKKVQKEKRNRKEKKKKDNKKRSKKEFENQQNKKKKDAFDKTITNKEFSPDLNIKEKEKLSVNTDPIDSSARIEASSQNLNYTKPIKISKTNANFANNPQKKPSGSKKLLFYIIAILFLGILAGLGLYFYLIIQEKNEKKDFLSKTHSDFKKAIVLINDLKTEDDFPELNNNFSKYSIIQKDEIDKINQSLKQSKSALETIPQTPPGYSLLSQKLNNFYKDLNTNLEKYKKFVEFDLFISEKIQKSNDLYEQYDSKIQKEDLDKEGLMTEMNKLNEGYNQIVKELKEIQIEENLTGLNQKFIDHFEKMADAIHKTNEALEADNIEQARLQIDEFFKEKESRVFYNSISELGELHINEYKKEFNELRQQADKIKSSIVAKKTELDLTLAEIQIESW